LRHFDRIKVKFGTEKKSEFSAFFENFFEQIQANVWEQTGKKLKFRQNLVSVFGVTADKFVQLNLSKYIRQLYKITAVASKIGAEFMQNFLLKVSRLFPVSLEVHGYGEVRKNEENILHEFSADFGFYFRLGFHDFFSGNMIVENNLFKKLQFFEGKRFAGVYFHDYCDF
jgi:hypothetical protein